ncbi:hypothetical protein ACQPZX_35300 [Actinoplanes sp. CA-142083]|uniref:hypothetical protein n=1 Tax=Actinoplanes sp. CA-142083 TaxID=3239903 RepID=UPI003D8B8510
MDPATATPALADLVSGMTPLLTRAEFRDGLEVALLARIHMAGDPAAGHELERRRAQAFHKAAKKAIPDAYGSEQRHLAALAEAYTRLPGGVPVAAQLVATALALPLGGAALAGLTLAESVSIVAPRDTESIRIALDAAETAAHAIPDPAERARVAELLKRWWPTPPDPGEAVGALLRDPGAPRFTTVHLAGRGPVADPGMPPLIAARLSAAIVVASGPGPRLAAQLRRLAPLAAPDPAAHATVLTRLLLATPAEDVPMLEKIRP